MKRLLLVIFTLFLFSTTFAQRLWVTDSYIRLYNTTSKQDFYTPIWAVTRFYVKDKVINIYSSEVWSINYNTLTQYNGGSVPPLDTIISDILGGLNSASSFEGIVSDYMAATSFSRNETMASGSDTIVGLDTTYVMPLDTTCVWGIYGGWRKNTDSVSFIPYTSYRGITTIYPGLDTVIVTGTTGTISWDDNMFSGDTLKLRVIATDTLIWDRLKVHLTK